MKTLQSNPNIIRPNNIYKGYLAAPSHSINPIKLPETLIHIKQADSILVLDCNLPNAMHGFMNSPLRVEKLDKRSSARITSIPVFASSFHENAKSSGEDDDENESESPTAISPVYLPSTCTLSPGLRELDDVMQLRKMSCADLVTQELSLYKGGKYVYRNLPNLNPNPSPVRRGFRPAPIQIEKNELPDNYEGFLHNYPDRYEINGVTKLLEELQNSPCRVHIANLSSSEAVLLASKHKGDYSLTTETSLHYLVNSNRSIQPKDTRFKLNPPIRGQENRTELWKLLELDAVECISGMHEYVAPAYKALDTREFKRAIPGIPSLGYSLSGLWSELISQNSHLSQEQLELWLVKIVHMMSSAVSSVFKLGKYGKIEEGCFANLVVFAPYEQVTGKLYNHSMCPYEDNTLFGCVKRVYLRGELVYDGKVCNQLGKAIDN